MEKLLLEKNRLLKEKDQLESAFLTYKNVTAPALLLEKDIELNEMVKLKLELAEELNVINAQLDEKNCEKAKLTKEISLLKTKIINLSDPAISKESEENQTELTDKESLENKYMKMPPRSKAKDRRKTVNSSFNCGICNRSFKSRNLIYKHITGVHQEVNSSFNCDMCHKSFKSRNLIYRHMTGVHQEVNSLFNCDICHKSFKSRNLLYRHMTKGHQEEVHGSLYIRCDICKRKVKGKQGLKIHTREVHSEVRFRCTICLKISKSARCFRAHFQKVHKGGKHSGLMSFAEEYIPEPTDIMPTLSNTCDICKKQCSGKDELRAHEKESHSEVLYKCTGCFESFKTARCFRDHFRMIHKAGNLQDVMNFAEEYNPDDIMPVLERQI
ncbi:GDNF-inducible zinc finger protein 1-like isoform X2 [Belonocnema kinseyi]|uniref:GDNF-inducible zinc finger protein 1-like isoform X2 n=1 Tax=Belonocnema kinseyi TaxID=2817044 RepID=UPI00143CF52B|nr:GDNF-inducible zinc finger protein 1-like isoform X2 [Belonocnema kinseyi]